MSHRPLSEELSQLLARPEGGQGLTFNQLIEKTVGRGVYLALVLLSVPFITPVPVWGLSTIFGTIIVVLALRLCFSAAPRLPGKFGDREIPAALRKVIAGGGIKVLQLVERVVRPRRNKWMGWPVTRAVHGGLIVFLALLLALPLPIPLTNSFPAISIILVAVSMMEEDGVTIFFGYAMTVATVVYFALLTELIRASLVKIFETVRHFLMGNGI